MYAIKDTDVTVDKWVYTNQQFNTLNGRLFNA